MPQEEKFFLISLHGNKYTVSASVINHIRKLQNQVNHLEEKVVELEKDKKFSDN